MLIGYVLLFACVLPCICWGAVGTPGHPHAAPHFVFTDPPMRDATPTLVPHEHSERVSLCHAHLSGRDTSGVPASDAAGRSVPDTVIVISLIMLTLLVGWNFQVPSLYHVRHALATLFAQSADLAVPTPPPRLPAHAMHERAV